MFLMPKHNGRSNPFTTPNSYINRAVSNTNARAKTETDKRYDKIDKNLGSYTTEISTEIKKLKKTITEIREQYPNNTKIVIEGSAVIASLYGTKLQAIKAMMSATKERAELKLKEIKTIHDITGKNTSGLGGSVDNRIGISSTMAIVESRDIRAGDAMNILPSYGQAILAEDEANVAQSEVQQESVQRTQPVQSTQAVVTDVPKPKAVANEMIPSDSDNSNILSPNTDTRFANLLEDVSDDSENSKYLVNGDELSSNFARTNVNMSYAGAAISIRNKMNETSKVVHYDPSNGISWIRTHNKDGSLVDYEGLSSLRVTGEIEVIERNGSYEASDDLGHDYDVVLDTIDNMPDILKEEYSEIENINK